VNVNTTDATTGVTALLLPAQNPLRYLYRSATKPRNLLTMLRTEPDLRSNWLSGCLRVVTGSRLPPVYLNQYYVDRITVLTPRVVTASLPPPASLPRSLAHRHLTCSSGHNATSRVDAAPLSWKTTRSLSSQPGRRRRVGRRRVGRRQEGRRPVVRRWRHRLSACQAPVARQA